MEQQQQIAHVLDNITPEQMAEIQAWEESQRQLPEYIAGKMADDVWSSIPDNKKRNYRCPLCKSIQ